MKAIAFRKASSLSAHDCLVDVERQPPVPGHRDLLVAVRAVSVNPVDTKVRMGSVSVPDDVDVLGWDAAGVVEAVGTEVSGFQAGDEVFYSGTITRSGGNAELHTVDERLVGRKPSSLSFAEAAALPLTTLTAWQLLFHRLGVVPGKSPDAGTLLIVGGAGGVLISWARSSAIVFMSYPPWGLAESPKPLISGATIVKWGVSRGMIRYQ
jgi:NADPH:quinone reductase-like Zn-dependent oxidoreductase